MSKKSQQEQASKKSQSDETSENPQENAEQKEQGGGVDEGAGPEKATEEAVKQSEEVADGADAEDYDPFNDPVVPSSDVAQQIATELKGLGESPTLQALHEGRKDDEDK